MDRLNHLNLAWIPLLIAASAAVGVGLAWLLGGRSR